MQKRVASIAGLLALVVLLAAFFLRVLPGGGMQARAARLHTTFTSPYNISNSPNPGVGENVSLHARAQIADDGFLHVTWMEGTEGQNEHGPAYVRGQSIWPEWEWVGPHDNLGYTNPTIALDSSRTVHLAWTGGGDAPYDIYYATKPESGSWSAVTNLSDDANNSVYPSIAIDDLDRVWVTWETEISPDNFEVHVKDKPAGGSWSAAVNISNQSGQDLEPDIAIGVYNVPHIVWRNNAGAVWDIYYARYSAGSWSSPLNLSANTTNSHFARVAADDYGDVFVVWEDDIDGQDRLQILFRRWDGSQWGEIKRVSSTPAKALNPAISVDHCNLYVVWTDYRNTSTETYFSHSTDCGSTWLGDENVSSNDSSSFRPDVVAQPSGIAHIFWHDYAPGQYDIYYSKATTDVPPPTPTPTPGAWQGYLPVVSKGWAVFGGYWESEPNNSPSQANGPLVSGKDVGGYPADTDDYYSFVAGAGEATVQMWDYAPGTYGQLFLYDSTMLQIGWDNNPFDGWSIQETLSGGTYYVRIYTASGGQTNQQAYRLRVNAVP